MIKVGCDEIILDKTEVLAEHQIIMGTEGATDVESMNR